MTALKLANNENRAACAACGGKCCQRMPGSCYPFDMGETPEQIEKSLREALASGKYAVDWWDGDPRDGFGWETPGYMDRCLYVRPATMMAGDRVYDASWGGMCVFFEIGKGCSLSFEKRPFGCKDLMVNVAKPGECD